MAPGTGVSCAWQGVAIRAQRAKHIGQELRTLGAFRQVFDSVVSLPRPSFFTGALPFRYPRRT